MPALQWLCRRWRTGSDDFTWSGIVFAGLCLVSGVMCLVKVDTEDSSWPGCPLASAAFRNSFHALGVIDVIAALFLVILAGASFRGKIFEVNKRQLVPLMLYLTSVTFVIQFILSCIVASRAIYHQELSLCTVTMDKILVQVVLALDFFVPCSFLSLMVLSFDPSGRKKLETAEDYHRMWIERCRIVCCCHTNHKAGQEAFSEAALTLAALFRGYDIVPSDIAAGMLLMQGYQTHNRMQRMRQSVKFSPNPHNLPEVHSSQARPAHFLSSEQRLMIDKVHHFSKYFLGAYGWMLYTFMNCVTGLPRLWSHDLCMCCRKKRHGGVEYGEICGCDTNALKMVTGLSNDEILLTSFENTIYRPCFYVALDRPSNSVVVAVRGTMSLEDCITDMVASPAELLLDSASGVKGFVHSGMLQSATNILQTLLKDGLVNDLVSGRLKESNVVVLGHSLGAGTACILSILLWTRCPELRGRMQCIAYAPPGGLLCDTTRQFCKSFMFGAFAGFDVIPRMSAQNFDLLRDNILALLTHVNTPKAAVFCMCCCPSELVSKLPSFNPSDLQSEPMRTFQRVNAQGLPVPTSPTAREGPAIPHTQSSESTVPRTEIQLHPPLTMIHYVKMVREAKSSCCCCLSESGGLLTRLITNEVWCPIFVPPEELAFVVCHPMMTLDHFPDRVFDVIQSTQLRLQRGELQRFCSNDVQPEAPHPMADRLPMVYASAVPSSSASSSSYKTL